MVGLKTTPTVRKTFRGKHSDSEKSNHGFIKDSFV